MIEVAGIPVVELMDSQSPCLDIAVGFDNFEEAARQMTARLSRVVIVISLSGGAPRRRRTYHQAEGL